MSIVNFDKQKRPSDETFDAINRLYDSGLTGARKDFELSDIVVDLSKYFAYLVSKGERTEEDVDSFESLIPGDYAFLDQKNLKVALSKVKEQNTAALMSRDAWDKQSRSVSYSKGLRI